MKSIAVITLAVFGMLSLGACVSNERFESASTEITNQDEVIGKMKGEISRLESTNVELKSRLEISELELRRLRESSSSTGDVSALRSEIERLRRSLEELGRNDGDIVVRQTAEGPSLSVAGNVAFKTASHELSPAGNEILSRIASQLKATGAKIRVEGHTDNVPIVRKRGRYPLGNLELSGRRAMSVANALIEDHGIDRTRVSFAGYGSERPVASNDDEGGRTQNRRVDIVILERQ